MKVVSYIKLYNPITYSGEQFVSLEDAVNMAHRKHCSCNHGGPDECKITFKGKQMILNEPCKKHHAWGIQMTTMIDYNNEKTMFAKVDVNGDERKSVVQVAEEIDKKFTKFVFDETKKYIKDRDMDVDTALRCIEFKKCFVSVINCPKFPNVFGN